ncbi:hypothetical protein K432DRAFT_132151, partial [Lepidopterella palustris CBS 459.81]
LSNAQIWAGTAGNDRLLQRPNLDQSRNVCGFILLDLPDVHRQGSNNELAELIISESPALCNGNICREIWGRIDSDGPDNAPWDSYRVLVIEQLYGIAGRRGMGHVYQDSLADCLSSATWKQSHRKYCPKQYQSNRNRLCTRGVLESEHPAIQNLDGIWILRSLVQLSDPSCTTSGCSFSGGADPGPLFRN